MYYQNNAFGNGNNLGYGLGFGPFDWINTTPKLFTLKGKVVDGTTNMPLSASHVYYIKNGQKVGVITNANGEYVLEALPTDVIIISYMGFESIEAPANKIRDIEYLQPKTEQLKEVLVNAPKTPPKKPQNTNLLIGLGVVAIVVIASIASKSEIETPQNT